MQHCEKCHLKEKGNKAHCEKCEDSVMRMLHNISLKKILNESKIQREKSCVSPIFTCKICNTASLQSEHSVVVCDHHKGDVHMDCCTNNCSWDKKPCNHASNILRK